MMLNSGNNALYGVFMPLHHSLYVGFPSMIFEGGSFDPHDPPGSTPAYNYVGSNHMHPACIHDVNITHVENNSPMESLIVQTYLTAYIYTHMIAVCELKGTSEQTAVYITGLCIAESVTVCNVKCTLL